MLKIRLVNKILLSISVCIYNGRVMVINFLSREILTKKQTHYVIKTINTEETVIKPLKVKRKK